MNQFKGEAGVMTYFTIMNQPKTPVRIEKQTLADVDWFVATFDDGSVSRTSCHHVQEVLRMWTETSLQFQNNIPEFLRKGIETNHLDLTIQRQGDQWSATATDQIFAGQADSLEAAIGKFMIANREQLNFTFTVVDQDGTIRRSSNYGKPRRNTP